jgi:hypothetical protein
MSNRLPILADEIRCAHADVQEAAKTAADRAIDAGNALIEARALVAHGEWLPFLEQAGVKERRARQYMQLARSGLKSATVADLGGIRAALEWLAMLPSPPAAGSNTHLVISLDGFSREMGEPFVVLEGAAGGNVWAYRFDLSSGQPWWEQPRRPVERDAVWPVVLSLLGGRAAEMSFGFVAVPESPLLAVMAGGGAAR